MRHALPAGPVAYALMTVVAVLGGTIAATLWRGTDAAALLQTPALPMTAPQLVSAAPRAAGLAYIKSRALFYASRTFFIEVVQPTAVQLPPPAYLLEGTLLIPGKPAMAFLKHQPDGASKTVHPGDGLDGWKVGAVRSGGVIFADGTRRIEITAKGSTSVASFHSTQIPGSKTHRAAGRPVVLGARGPEKPRPIWSSNTHGQKPAIRVYRPPD